MLRPKVRTRHGCRLKLSRISRACVPRRLGFAQTLTTQLGTRTFAPITTSATFTLDASGSITSDSTRTFSFDASGDMARVSVGANYRGTATAAAPNGSDKVERRYLTNALGQRVFKSEPTYSAANGSTAPSADILGDDFVAWLKKNFNWLWTTAQTNVTLGDSFVYAEADSGIPSWALLGQYGNGASSNTGRSEIIWLPIESGGGDATAIPIGWSRGNRLYAIHSDHLGTPRRLTDDDNKAVWQWPYSAYGDNKPSGVLKATTNPNAALTNQPELLRATAAIEFNLRFPGQYADSDTGLSYNYFRHYNPQTGRYVQSDPIGLDGGVNRFGYVGGDPLRSVDPFGLCTCIARTDIDNKSSFKFDKLIGDERVVTGQYQCTDDDGKKSNVAGTHRERYFRSWDDGRRGNVIGQNYAQPPGFELGKGLSFTQRGYQSFDPLKSESPDLKSWATQCGCK